MKNQIQINGHTLALSNENQPWGSLALILDGKPTGHIIQCIMAGYSVKGMEILTSTPRQMLIRMAKFLQLGA